MKILYVTTVSMTMEFFPEHFKMLLSQGHTVELACNCEEPVPQACTDLGLKVHHVAFSRSPLSKGNLTAIRQLADLVKSGKYDIVHTHTPNASACARLACRKLRKKGLKVFYTAHGFHFYKGAPLLNWLVFYPVEWLCAHWTDVLITINREDYELAQKHMHAKSTVYIPGVGIDLEKFGHAEADREKKRKELGVPLDAKLLFSVGELNGNKNHETVIRAINEMDVYYIIAGEGDRKEYLQNLIDTQGMTDRIKLLGYRTDVKDLYAISDLFVFPSFREGLSVSLMEAMASGLPCAVSKIRGNTDLIDEAGGALFSPDAVEECTEAIRKALEHSKAAMGEHNQKKVVGFSKESVVKQLEDIYG